MLHRYQCDSNSSSNDGDDVNTRKCCMLILLSHLCSGAFYGDIRFLFDLYRSIATGMSCASSLIARHVSEGKAVEHRA
jgi:hypothetical protein